MSVELPDELIVEILSILPVKWLLRCRLVCKSWLNLISSTEFKVMHLHNFNQLNPLYFIRRLDHFVPKEWFCVHFDDEPFTLDSGTQIEFPFAPIRVSLCFRIVGCCNGVVCLSDDSVDDSDDITFSLDAIILWNPSIRRKLTLPLPFFKSIDFEDCLVVLGFGYDKISNDYKVVRLAYEDYGFTEPHVEVYTLKTGIWREVIFPDDLCCIYIHYNWSRIFFNGCVHWIASNFNGAFRRSSIMTFDITTELFGEIQLPEFLAQKHFLMLSVVGESLAIIHSSYLNFDMFESGSRYMVMVMKEYKNPASWTMLYHVHYPDVDLGKPLRLRNNGDMIVELGNRDLIMINHDEGYYVHVGRDGEEENSDDNSYMDRYEESLALLDVGDSVPNKEAMEVLKIKNQDPS